MEERTPLLDVEEGLKGDFNGTFKKQLEDELFDGLSSLRRTMDAGLSGEDFAKAEKFRVALEAARTTVDTVWGVMNK
ncbi:MAG: hypothetical protein H0S85_02990 [Desulfovibrionaceae bacterium]|jgi:hypothetical protein|nr:hypothetical protein [Desulfovibrionaceae bacterium]